MFKSLRALYSNSFTLTDDDFVEVRERKHLYTSANIIEIYNEKKLPIIPNIMLFFMSSWHALPNQEQITKQLECLEPELQEKVLPCLKRILGSEHLLSKYRKKSNRKENEFETLFKSMAAASPTIRYNNVMGATGPTGPMGAVGRPTRLI